MISLLTRVCEDYSLDAAEVLPRYLEAPTAPAPATKKPRAPKAPKAERPMCSHEVRGQPCKHKAQVGDDLCHIHKKQRDNPKAPPAPKRVCVGTTSKGAPCTVKAQEGCELCHLHMAKANAPPKEKKPRVVKKAVAPQVEGRGESPPPVFCEACPVAAVEASLPDPAADPEEEMEAMRQRLAAIMVSAAPEEFRPTQETLEAHGMSDDPEDWDPEQMESPHSQELVEKMKAFQVVEDDEEFMEE